MMYSAPIMQEIYNKGQASPHNSSCFQEDIASDSVIISRPNSQANYVLI